MRTYSNSFVRLQRKMRELEDYIPDTIAGFEKLYRKKATEGALSVRTKELMALCLAVHSGHSDCAVMQLQETIDAGATDAEITEAIEVALMMGGVPALVAGSDVVEALETLRSANTPDMLYHHHMEQL